MKRNNQKQWNKISQFDEVCIIYRGSDCQISSGMHEKELHWSCCAEKLLNQG